MTGPFPNKLEELDASFFRAIKLKPQELGGHLGVPLPVFHRLYAAGKVFINEDGKVQSL